MTLSENDPKLKYPISVFFIVVNEFCERFSYYGMKTVLILYLKNVLGFDENQSTVYYHAFAMLCYFTPVFGAILADTYLGKFKTILYLSIFYACGNILLAVASIPNALPQTEFSLLGLFIIGVGTGGIKPCVSAFGGDQFVRPQQDFQLQQFFTIFYVSINAGALLSTFATPYLREMQCFGDKSCFPLAFGVPAILMIVAVVVFIIGKPKYKIRPAEGNIMVDFVKCVTYAISRKIKSKGETRAHWLEFASDRYDYQLIKDIQQVFNVLVLYLPIPVIWALFDQQGSRWTFQATRMDGTIGSATILPDQMQIVNPLFILVLAPLFQSLIYPCFAKCGLLTTLQRIGAGGIIAGLAFVISGFVELSLEPTYEKIPGEGLTQLNFINTLPCSVNLSYVYPNNQTTRFIELGPQTFIFERDLEAQMIPITARLADDSHCGELIFSTPEWTGKIEGASKKAYSVMITGRNGHLELIRMIKEEPLQKSSSGKPRLGFIFDIYNGNHFNDVYEQGNISIRSKEDTSDSREFFAYNTTSLMSTVVNGLISTEVKDISLGTYQVFAPHHDGKENTDEPASSSITLQQGGCYTAVIQRGFTSRNASQHTDDVILLIEVTPPNSVHMLWLIPQFFVMTVAEVLFSVAGSEFSYTQAPASMKSVMQAAWLLTVAFGNLIVMVVAQINGIPRQSMEFFLFAGLMGVDMLWFIFLAFRYTYVETQSNDKENNNTKPATPVPSSAVAVHRNQGRENKAYTETPM